MGERKTILVQTGQREIPMSPAEFDDYMASLPKAARRNVTTKKAVPSLYQAQGGQWKREDLDHDQLVNRMNTGERPIIRDAKDPKLAAERAQRQADIEKKIAGKQNILAAANAVTPVIGPMLQDAVMGKEVATEARMKLKAANPLIDVGLGVALPGRGLGAVFGGMKRTGVLGTAGRMLAGETAINTYMHGKYLYEANKPFVYEDFAKDLIYGTLFAAPFAMGPCLRAGHQERGEDCGASALRKGGLLRNVGDLLVTKAVLSKPGTAAAANAARSGAAAKLMGRVFGKKRPKVGQVDEVAKAKQMAQVEAELIGRFTPKEIAKLTPSKAKAFIKEVDGLSGSASLLDDIDFKTIQTRVNRAGNASAQARQEALNLNKKMQQPGVWTEQFPVERQGKYTAEAGATFERIQAAGWIDNTADLGVLQHSIDPGEAFGGWLKARYNARLQAGKPGSRMVESEIRKFTENADVWGPDLAKRAKRINTAFDDLGALSTTSGTSRRPATWRASRRGTSTTSARCRRTATR